MTTQALLDTLLLASKNKLAIRTLLLSATAY
jgi:hypothetical protein